MNKCRLSFRKGLHGLHFAMRLRRTTSQQLVSNLFHAPPWTGMTTNRAQHSNPSSMSVSLTISLWFSIIQENELRKDEVVMTGNANNGPRTVVLLSRSSFFVRTCLGDRPLHTRPEDAPCHHFELGVSSHDVGVTKNNDTMNRSERTLS